MENPSLQNDTITQLDTLQHILEDCYITNKDSKIMSQAPTYRPLFIVSLSYDMGRNMIAKLSNNNQRKKKVQAMTPRTTDHHQEDRSTSDDASIKSQESGISSSSSSTSNNSYGSSQSQNHKLVFDGVYV